MKNTEQFFVAQVFEQLPRVISSPDAHMENGLVFLSKAYSLCHAQLVKLPKNLLAKVPTIKNTEQILEQLPRVISSLDAHMESGLQKSEPSRLIEYAVTLIFFSYLLSYNIVNCVICKRKKNV